MRALHREWTRLTDRLLLRRSTGRTAIDGFQIVVAPDDAATANRILTETTARYLVLVRPGAVVSAKAVRQLARRLRDDTFDLVYGDSRTSAGRRRRPPASSPYRLREEDHLGPVVLVSVPGLRALGGFRTAADGAQLLDVALRTSPDRVLRVRDVLGIEGPALAPRDIDAEVRVTRAALAEAGVSATVGRAERTRPVVYAVKDEPLVSVIIPTRGGSGTIGGSSRVFVVDAVRSIIESSTWRHVELVVVADDATPQSVVDALVSVAGDRLRLVRWSEPFNFSAKMNRGAAVAKGEYLLMLNDDIEVVTPEWIDRMLGLVQQPGVGMVGATLFFEDGTVQHLGHLYHRSAAGHAGFGLTPGRDASFEELTITREVSGVTAACALLPTEVFREVGGFSVAFPGNYNDVDLSLKVRSTGYAILNTGSARLYHFESRTRDAQVLPEEIESLRRRWDAMMQLDEFERSHEP